MTFTSYDIVRKFEETIAEYTGSKYAVAVESCCSALFLCCKYLKVKQASIPKYTYPGVACSIINAGGKVKFDGEWNRYSSTYYLEPYPIIDSALFLPKKTYIKNTFVCLSFHIKKHIPIGRGGMILTDDLTAYKWLKKSRFDGRSECSLLEDNIDMIGWNMYLTPEQAARGLIYFDLIKSKDFHNIDWKSQGYPDLSKVKVYAKRG